MKAELHRDNGGGCGWQDGKLSLGEKGCALLTFVVLRTRVFSLGGAWLLPFMLYQAVLKCYDDAVPGVQLCFPLWQGAHGWDPS